MHQGLILAYILAPVFLGFGNFVQKSTLGLQCDSLGVAFVLYEKSPEIMEVL